MLTRREVRQLWIGLAVLAGLFAFFMILTAPVWAEMPPLPDRKPMQERKPSCCTPIRSARMYVTADMLGVLQVVKFRTRTGCELAALFVNKEQGKSAAPQQPESMDSPRGESP